METFLIWLVIGFSIVLLIFTIINVIANRSILRKDIFRFDWSQEESGEFSHTTSLIGNNGTIQWFSIRVLSSDQLWPIPYFNVFINEDGTLKIVAPEPFEGLIEISRT